MYNEILSFSRRYGLISPGDRVVCAVSGGADSVALLFSLYLLQDPLQLSLSAAHFNHQLRGAESDRDENFVREFCERYDIPLTVGRGRVTPGKKGLEAAARDARYAFLSSLPGKIATAHTADDNLETVLMHLVRGTGLKGLGGIAPQNGNVIRPMLGVTRTQVEGFLREWSLDYVQDSSNETGAFLRNRLRHQVVPLLKQENPALAENVSAMALLLRQDEEYLSQASRAEPEVAALRSLHPALRARALEAFLKDSGVKEPERAHIAQAQSLVFTDKPSAYARFPGGITIARCYDRLEVRREEAPPASAVLLCPGVTRWGEYRITCEEAGALENTPDTFTIVPVGPLMVRPRQTGDSLRLPGGTRTLKKLFIDRKIPAAQRSRIPVLADGAGVLGVHAIGTNLDRAASSLPAIRVHIEKEHIFSEGRS